jgi:uncharacterized membrane protein YesL
MQTAKRKEKKTPLGPYFFNDVRNAFLISNVVGFTKSAITFSLTLGLKWKGEYSLLLGISDGNF